jgi:hypothetical protein
LSNKVKSLRFRIDGVLECERKVEKNSDKMTKQEIDQHPRYRIRPEIKK